MLNMKEMKTVLSERERERERGFEKEIEKAKCKSERIG